MTKQLLRVGEAADVLAVSRWTIYRWVEDDRLEGTRSAVAASGSFARRWIDWFKATRRMK